MKAIQVMSGPEEGYRLDTVEMEEPRPGTGEVLVSVHAVGVNRADVLQRKGRYPPPEGASPILGLELAGEVVATGPGCSRSREGDRVMALVTGGAYATRAVAPEATTLTVPEGWSWPEAAAVPEAFLTAWLNLVDLGRLEPGERVLIHAGASGVGSAAIQLARELGGEVVVTATGTEKLDFCRALGAASAIDRREEDLDRAVRESSGGRGVDLVLDVGGAPYWERNLTVLDRGGRLVLIGLLGGATGNLGLAPIMRKNLTVRGTTLRGTPLPDKAGLVEAFGAFALPRFADGRLRPIVDRVFPLAQAAEAHTHMEDDRNLGKIILEVD